MFYAFASVFEMLRVYALTAGMAAANIPTKIVSSNKYPSFSQTKSSGLKEILNSLSADPEIKLKAILPTIVPKTKPVMHKRRLSIITKDNSCSLLAPLTLSRANSYLRSFNVLYSAMKMLMPEMSMMPYARYCNACSPIPNSENSLFISIAGEAACIFVF